MRAGKNWKTKCAVANPSACQCCQASRMIPRAPRPSEASSGWFLQKTQLDSAWHREHFQLCLLYLSWRGRVACIQECSNRLRGQNNLLNFYSHLRSFSLICEHVCLMSIRLLKTSRLVLSWGHITSANPPPGRESKQSCLRWWSWTAVNFMRLFLLGCKAIDCKPLALCCLTNAS